MPAGASRRPTACCEKYCAPTPGSPDHSSAWRAFAVIDRDEGEFVEPGSDVALRGHEAGRETAAEGDAEHGVIVERHRAGERGDFAIVDHVERDAVPGGLQVEEEAADAGVEAVLRHAAVERADADFVVHIDARGAAADGIDARQVRGGALQRIVDAVEVILRVALYRGVPGDLVAEDHLAVDDRGALAVAGAEVEADAAAFQMAAEGRGGFALLGAGVVGRALDGHGAAVDALAHEVDSRRRARPSGE